MFAKRLIGLREEKEITQQDLANLMFVSKATVSHYELGKSKPDYDKLIWLCEFFNVSTDYMLGVSEVRLPYNFTPPKSVNDDEKQLLNFYNRLNEENKIVIKGKMIELYKEQSYKKSVKKTNIG